MMFENFNIDSNSKEAQILKSIIYDYIITGKPVGSRSFVQKYAFSISPATMRNIMSDLEKMGYLAQPHTSAGRLPTYKGYRFYVDSLLNDYNYDLNEELPGPDRQIKKELELEDVFNSLLKMLSKESNYASVMLTPKLDYTVVKRIELVPLDDNAILMVLVTRTGMIINKRITLSTYITQENLGKHSNYLTSELSGYSLFEIKNELLDKLRKDTKEKFKNDFSEAEMAFDIAELAFGNIEEPRLEMQGIENLLKIPEMVEQKKINSLLQFIEKKEILADLMVEMLDKDGIFALIGEELPYEDIVDCSMITTTYKIGTKKVGALGVIGPTRMDYKKNVPLIDYAGKLISDLLSKISK